MRRELRYFISDHFASGKTDDHHERWFQGFPSRSLFLASISSLVLSAMNLKFLFRTGSFLNLYFFNLKCSASTLKMANNQSSVTLFPPGYLEEYNAQIPISVGILFIVLEVVCVVLRFWARIIGKIAWGVDDTLIIISAILCLALIACCLGEQCPTSNFEAMRRAPLVTLCNRWYTLWRCWVSLGSFRYVLSFNTCRLGKIHSHHSHGEHACDSFPKAGNLGSVPSHLYQTQRSNCMLGYWSSNGRKLRWSYGSRIFYLYPSRISVEQNHPWGPLYQHKCVVSVEISHERSH